jgi:ribosomal-protein-alanine N-acetyltransferase
MGETVAPLSRPLIVGQRVYLRHFCAADRAEWSRLRDDNEDFLRPWEPTPPGGDDWLPSDIAFSSILATTDTPQSQRFAICLIEDNRIVGQLSLNNIVRGAAQHACAGYWIASSHARRGLMTEALRLALAYAFEVLSLHRVEAHIIPRNAPSKALVRRIGFRYEGLARGCIRVAGNWEDHERWGITAEEWNTLRAGESAACRAHPPVSDRRSGGSSVRR